MVRGGHEAAGGGVLPRRGAGHPPRPRPPAHHARALAEGRVRGSCAPPGRTRTATRSTRSASRGEPVVRRHRPDHVPVGPSRGRGLPDRAGRRRVGGADGHADLPPVAGACRGRRPPRRAADRPRPAAGDGLRGRGAGRGSGARAARGPRDARLPEDERQRGVHVYVRIEPRWTFTDVRHAAIAFGRELERRGSPRSGGRRSAGRTSSSTTTRTPATARSRAPTACGRSRARRCRRR